MAQYCLKTLYYINCIYRVEAYNSEGSDNNHGKYITGK